MVLPNCQVFLGAHHALVIVHTVDGEIGVLPGPLPGGALAIGPMTIKTPAGERKRGSKRQL